MTHSRFARISTRLFNAPLIEIRQDKAEMLVARAGAPAGYRVAGIRCQARTIDANGLNELAMDGVEGERQPPLL